MKLYIWVWLCCVTLRSQTLVISKTLEESFQAALKNSELILEQDELIKQQEQKNTQAWASVLPAISSSLTYQRQAALTNSPLSNIFPETQTNWKISATQPLFHGLRDYAALRQTRNFIDSQTYNRKQQIANLYANVAVCFYQILSLKEEVALLKKEIELSQNRLKEIKNYNQIGKTKESDVLTLESSILSLESQIESLNYQLKSQQELYSYLTLYDENTLLIKEDSWKISIEPLPYYQKKILDRQDVKTAMEEIKSSEESVKIAWGLHLPAVDLTGNYYLYREGTPLRDVNWDVQLTASIPIFQWGGIHSQVKEARASLRIKELRLLKTKRAAEQEVKTLYHSIQSQMVSVEKLKRALELSRKNISAVNRDLKRGMSTQADLLFAEVSAQQIHRNLIRTEYSLRTDLLRLEVASTLKPKEAL